MSLHDRLRAIRARPRSGGVSDTSSRQVVSVPTGVLPDRGTAYPALEPVPLQIALKSLVGFSQIAPFVQSRIVNYPLTSSEAWRYFIAPEVDRRELVFLDLETTGLGGGAGNMAFLVGLGRLVNNELQVEQVLLEDFPGEPELLAYLDSRISPKDWVISYNGLTFDCALLRDRFALHGRRHSFERQFDLLYPVRALYRRRLSNCSLSTVELELLGVRRPVDLPGAFAPERYFQYLRQGDMSVLSEVCAHHVQDIVGLYLVWAHLEELCARASMKEDLLSLAAPVGYVAPADPVALGRLLLSSRRPGLRGTLCDATTLATTSGSTRATTPATTRATTNQKTSAVNGQHDGTLARNSGEIMLRDAVYDQQLALAERREAGMHLGRSFNSCGRWNDAYDVFMYLYSELHDRAAGVEVAKILEHRLGDLAMAAEIVRTLLRRVPVSRDHDSRYPVRRSNRVKPKAGITVASLRYRLARLERKMACRDG